MYRSPDILLYLQKKVMVIDETALAAIGIIILVVFIVFLTGFSKLCKDVSEIKQFLTDKKEENK